MDLKELYNDMLNEVSEEREALIRTNRKEADKFMDEVVDHYASHCDAIYDQWKDSQIRQ